MRINAINSFNTYSTNLSFKHTAVPYPEYENSYNKTYNEGHSAVKNLVSGISKFFSPEVKNNAEQIKSDINVIYKDEENNAVIKKDEKSHFSAVA